MMLFEELVSHEERQYRYRLGTILASSFAGFLAGFVVGAAMLYVITQSLGI